MNPETFYRLASGLLVLLAAGHTVGIFRPVTPTPEVAGVRKAMQDVQFKSGGFTRTVGRFYFGFSLLMTFWVLASAVLSWQLGGFAAEVPNVVRAIAWPFCFAQVALAAVCWTCLNPPPAVLATLAAISIGVATLGLAG